MRKLPQLIGVAFWMALACGLAILATRVHPKVCALLAAGCLGVSAMLVNDILHNRY